MDMKNDMNIMGIIGLVGAIILVVGVFIGWMTPDTNASKILFGTDAYSGWDIYNNLNNITKSQTGYSGLAYSYVPLVALICGIISLLLMIVPTFMNVEKFRKINDILGIVALVLSLVAVICGLLFYLQHCTFATIDYALKEQFKFGAGFWLVFVGAVITLVGGLMPILKDKGIIKF